MTSYYAAQVGQPAGDLKCCGASMRHVDNGIYECKRCGCHVYIDDLNLKVEDVQFCRSHRR
jgi:hypothetical protein